MKKQPNRQWGVIIVISFVLFFARTCFATILQTESKTYQVIFTAIDLCNEGKCMVTFHVLNKQSGKTREVSFSNMTHEVREITLLDHDRLLVRGYPMSLTLFDLCEGQIIDEIFGNRPILSPDQTKLVYEFRYVGPPLYETSVLLLYDLTKSPQENSMTGSVGNPEERGIILYPEINRIQNTYFIPAQRLEDQHHIISPLVWNAASTKVCFIQQNGQGPWETRLTPSWLVVIDISHEANAPQITTLPIDATRFYKSRVLKNSSEESLEQAIFAKELSFTDNDSGIIIQVTDSDIFDGSKIVTIPLEP